MAFLSVIGVGHLGECARAYVLCLNLAEITLVLSQQSAPAALNFICDSELRVLFVTKQELVHAIWVIGIIDQDLVADLLLLSHLLLDVCDVILKLCDLILNGLIFAAF